MVKVILANPVRYPFGFDNVYRKGTVLEVSVADEKKLRAMGVLANEDDQVAEDDDVVEAFSEGETPAVVNDAAPTKFGPLPKKTQGINVWREYAREHDIDVRGLTEAAELMGHVIKVVNSQ